MTRLALDPARMAEEMAEFSRRMTLAAQQLATLDVLYANYLAAGAACLTARGYQVQMNVPGQ